MLYFNGWRKIYLEIVIYKFCNILPRAQRKYIITINLWWDLTRPIREEANLRREEQREEKEKYKEVDYDENKEHREDGSSSGRGRRWWWNWLAATVLLTDTEVLNWEYAFGNCEA